MDSAHRDVNIMLSNTLTSFSPLHQPWPIDPIFWKYKNWIVKLSQIFATCLSLLLTAIYISQTTMFSARYSFLHSTMTIIKIVLTQVTVTLVSDNATMWQRGHAILHRNCDGEHNSHHDHIIWSLKRCPHHLRRGGRPLDMPRRPIKSLNYQIIN